MDKTIRKAVKCYLIENNKVVVTKYKEGNPKSEYYDIPGGKIEEETPEQATIREMKEETGLEPQNLKYKGKMIVEYPNRIYDFDVFISRESKGKLQDAETNTSEWIDIKELLQKEKVLSNIILLDRFFIKGLIGENYTFSMHILVDEQENILDVDYKLKEI